MKSLALLEISNLAPSLLAVDRCVKGANVEIVGIESSDGAGQCIKLLGSPSDVAAAAELGVALAQQMGATATWSVIPNPLEEIAKLIRNKPAFSPTFGDYDTRIPKEKSMSPIESVGLLETQGLVAALHATPRRDARSPVARLSPSAPAPARRAAPPRRPAALA